MMRKLPRKISQMTNGKLDFYKDFEFCVFEGGHKTKRVVYDVLDSFPEPKDPVLSYSWSNGKDMYITMSNNNFTLLRDTTGDLIPSVCSIHFLTSNSIHFNFN